jgi:DNA polymerase alpha subunit B
MDDPPSPPILPVTLHCPASPFVAVADKLEEFMQHDYLKHTQLVLVPHTGDMTTHPAYPQWPVSSSPAGGRDGHLDAFRDPAVRRRVTAVSNPSTFVVGGVVVAATSADILFALNGEDTTRQPPAAGAGGPPRVERLPRMAQHVLEQRYFYPLFPAAPDTPLELSQLAATALPVSPDLLLLPSKLKQFTRPLLGGTLAVNPGTLCRANAGGSYAKLLLFPPTRGAMVTREWWW